VLRERVDSRWQDPDKLMPPSDKTREATHARVVADIARQRLAFPNDESPSLQTHVNVPETSLSIRAAGGGELTPDIVVAEAAGGGPRIVAAVETADTVTDEQAAGRWLPFSRVRDAAFHLYVPSGFAADARKLLKKHRIKNAGLHTWRYVAGQEMLDITDIDYGSLLERLLPPFLLRRRRR
jgi:hypothetical protein